MSNKNAGLDFTPHTDSSGIVTESRLDLDGKDWNVKEQMSIWWLSVKTGMISWWSANLRLIADKSRKPFSQLLLMLNRVYFTDMNTNWQNKNILLNTINLYVCVCACVCIYIIKYFFIINNTHYITCMILNWICYAALFISVITLYKPTLVDH